jgi:membrane protease YdiL (CAAX protease family)
MPADYIMVASTAASYFLFFLVSFIAWKNKNTGIGNDNGLVVSLNSLNIKNISSITILMIPLIIFRKAWLFLFNWPLFDSTIKIAIILMFMSAIASIALRSARKETAAWLKSYNTIRPMMLSAIIFYLVTRIFFLIVYECFFRGLLLTVCINEYGITAAIIINLTLYVLVHFFNGKREMLACIPFGLILCGITMWSQSVWPAIILHLILALIYESYLLLFPILSTKTVRS